MLLVNKYLPDNLEEILESKDIIELLKEYILYLLLAGSPGTGKTTVADILKKKFWILRINYFRW